MLQTLLIINFVSPFYHFLKIFFSLLCIILLLYFHTGNYYNSSLGIIIIADSDNVIFVHMLLEFFLHTGSFDFKVKKDH